MKSNQIREPIPETQNQFRKLILKDAFLYSRFLCCLLCHSEFRLVDPIGRCTKVWPLGLGLTQVCHVAQRVLPSGLIWNLNFREDSWEGMMGDRGKERRCMGVLQNKLEPMRTA